ncbi:pirin family protein [Blastococcus capsensis]|uniref:pirin family protein n=1 Tax=Blastococcus capsensis TaxID=1564163 RepID=UPI002541A8CF|nr:pirin family protein [Blastococcus capsensis]MDK3255815.1 pirin family protein [Blastococcus capsensis]
MNVPPVGALGTTPVTGLESRVVLAPDDGSLGPLLRIADDRLAPGAGYGRHEHRAVDVVAVVLAGTLTHRWAAGAQLTTGDVAVLRAGAGLAHDEVAGSEGAWVLQCYLRSAAPAVPAAPAAHVVHRGAGGWVDLGRADARLWIGRTEAGGELTAPPGTTLVADAGAVRRADGGRVRLQGPGRVLVWQLDVERPAWAEW